QRCLVGSEMCIRDRTYVFGIKSVDAAGTGPGPTGAESVRTGEPASRRACAGGANARPGGRSAVGILQERPDRLRNGSFR
ncbi:MAG: hypothetical protein QUU85_03230, partial [Candidatus Eisenbacteria bacterium]|nr:hypothetical protein [Candidatus Eisenbacteria bacterium]